MSKVMEQIKGIANDIYLTILKKKQPQLKMPIRSLQNVSYDQKIGYFELVGKEKERTLTASTIKTFAQTLRMMSLSKELIKEEDIATKREAYYVSKNWGDARFNEQPESWIDSPVNIIRIPFAIFEKTFFKGESLRLERQPQTTS